MLQCENALRLHGHARCESAVRALRSREHVNGRASSALLLNRPGRISSDSTGLNNGTASDGYPRQDDGPDLYARTIRDPGIEVNSPRHVMSEDNGLLFDDRVFSDMDTCGPGPVDMRGAGDPGRVIRSDLQTGAYGRLPEADSNIHRYLHGEGQD